jgi:hypothetical protein
VLPGRVGRWLNMVERFFRDLTEKQISRGVFRSVDQLETAILGAIEQHNSDPSRTSGPPKPPTSSKR